MSSNLLQRFVSIIARIGADPQDTDDIRLQKTLLVLSALMMSSLGVVWSSIYLAFGETWAAAIPFTYAVLSFLTVAFLARTRRYRFFRASQLLFSLLLPFLLMLALGGFVHSSAVVLWSLVSPIGALLFIGRRQAAGWFLAYLVLVIIGGFMEAFARPSNNLPPAVVTIFFVMNVGGLSAVTFILLQHFIGQKNAAFSLLYLEQEKSEGLLLNILPKEIADILKNENRVIADHYEGASILFADVVNFTPMSAQMTPTQLVELLNEVFYHFDTLVEKHGLEKIKTIGDCYMVAAGVPRPRPDHAHVLARLALEMQDYVMQREFFGRRLNFRIGINSGPVVAGVIGRKKFIYDLWGDAVNTASRMESHGAGGKVQITRATYDLIKDDFTCEPRGSVTVKGKGEMEVWYILGELLPQSALATTLQQA